MAKKGQAEEEEAEPKPLWLQIVMLVGGMVLIVLGSDFTVDNASIIAKVFGMDDRLIGLTIVAFGTSLPELVTSVTAATKGKADIAIGNIVGSNILNILIILGFSALVYPLVVSKTTILADIPVMIGATILLFALGYDGSISRIDAIIFLVAFVAYLAFLFYLTKKNQAAEKLLSPSDIEKEENSKTEKVFSLPKAILLTLVGLALIILGSNFCVDSATAIARMVGLSERFIGLTIVALGTSLPELFTSVSASIKKNSDIAIGNIVGSNIFNILFIVGLSGLIIPVPFAEPFRFDTIIALAAAVLLLLFALPKKRLSRVSGIVMLLAYVAYFIWIW